MPDSSRRPAAVFAAWLRGDHAEHARFLDMSRRVSAAHWFGLAIGGTKVLVSLWTGPWVLLTIVAAHLVIGVGIGVSRRRGGPAEPVSAAAFLAMQLVMATAVAITGGGLSPLLALMLVPPFTQALCFRPRVLWTGVALSAVLATAAVLTSLALPPVAPVPPLVHLVGYLALTAVLTTTATWLATADLAARYDAEVDAMTGLLNRKSLTARYEAARAAAKDGVVGVVVLDLDHFKAVNDTHGHDRGDQVLQEVAQRLRGSLRREVPLHRMGGEEFLVVLTGADEADTCTVAERLRAAVAREPVAGLALTVSCGVSSTTSGTSDLAALMRAADEALYEAKRSGRDCVRVATAERVG